VALIGCGRIAQVAHLPALENAAGIELVAVCDPSRAVAEAVARRYGVASAHTDANDVLADPSVEAVIVAAPDRFHYPLARAALEAGKHVLVEKPLASTTEEASSLVALTDATGLKLQVGAMKRHDAGLQWARAFVSSTLGDARSFTAWYRIGDLRAGIEATLFPPVIADENARGTEGGFKADRQQYLLATHGAHVFDTVRYLLGDRRRRRRTAPRRRPRPRLDGAGDDGVRCDRERDDHRRRPGHPDRGDRDLRRRRLAAYRYAIPVLPPRLDRAGVREQPGRAADADRRQRVRATARGVRGGDPR
jgi:predicted dehydrogenase